MRLTVYGRYIDFALMSLRLNVRFGSLADMCVAKRRVRFTPNSNRKSRHAANGYVRFAPESGHVQCNWRCRLWARSGHRVLYSITSSARTMSAGGTAMPSALAVFILIASSNLFACSIGSSRTLVPFRILTTYPAASRNNAEKSVP